MNNDPNQAQKMPIPETEPLNPGDQAPPGTFDTGENICRDCRGTGKRDGEPCPTCGGTGRVTEGIGGL